MWLEEIGCGNEGVFFIFIMVCSINLVLMIEGIIAGVCTVLRMPGMSLDLYICLGAIPLMITVLIRGIHVDWFMDAEHDLSILCQLYPCLLCFGLLWSTGSILIKCIAITSFYGPNKSLHVPRRVEWKANLLMVVLMMIEAAAAIVWIVVHPIRAHVYEHMAFCRGDYMNEWQMGIAIFHGAIVLLSAILVVPAFIRTDREAKVITGLLVFAVYNLMCVVIVAAVIHFMYADKLNSEYAYAINGGLILYAILVNLLVVFISKVLAVVKIKVDWVTNMSYSNKGHEIDTMQH